MNSRNCIKDVQYENRSISVALYGNAAQRGFGRIDVVCALSCKIIASDARHVNPSKLI